MVKKVLLGLNVNKSAGPDGISAQVLKKCASTLARPLRNLFYRSYSSGVFPSAWKVAQVQPVPKKGESSNPANYRPIAICSLLSKVMETIINYRLMAYLELNAFISDRQYGFRRNRSTGDLMAYLTEKWNRAIHGHGESKVVAFDITKAFDRVWHESQPMVSVIASCASFLQNRSIRVVIDGFASNLKSINAGVPQGSVLSPTLFLIFINDLLSLTANPIYSFADDSSLCHSYSFPRRPRNFEVADCRRNMNDSLNTDLQKIIDWGKQNRVDFNPNKTQSCLLTHKRVDGSDFRTRVAGVDVPLSDGLDILGMQLQNDLNWDKHIFEIAKKAAQSIGLLKRCKKYFTPSDLRNIYISYIRPKMEYNSHIWAGASQSALQYLDRIQERAKRLIGDDEVSSSLSPLGHRRDV